MIKTLMVVPLRDNNGRRFGRRVWQELELKLRELGGFTKLPGAYGEWVSDAGTLFRDRSRIYMVVLPAGRLPEWLAVVVWARERFQQEAIYVELNGTDVVGGG